LSLVLIILLDGGAFSYLYSAIAASFPAGDADERFPQHLCCLSVRGKML